MAIDDLRWRLLRHSVGMDSVELWFPPNILFLPRVFSLVFSIICSFQSFSWMWLVPPYSSKGVFLCFLVFRYKADFADFGLAPKFSSLQSRFAVQGSIVSFR
jgi:hypothetical protein